MKLTVPTLLALQSLSNSSNLSFLYALMSRLSVLHPYERISGQKLAHVLDPNYELPSQLIKPIQRICKLPLLMQVSQFIYEWISSLMMPVKSPIQSLA